MSYCEIYRELREHGCSGLDSARLASKIYLLQIDIKKQTHKQARAKIVPLHKRSDWLFFNHLLLSLNRGTGLSSVNNLIHYRKFLHIEFKKRFQTEKWTLRIPLYEKFMKISSEIIRDELKKHERFEVK